MRDLNVLRRECQRRKNIGSVNCALSMANRLLQQQHSVNHNVFDGLLIMPVAICICICTFVLFSLSTVGYSCRPTCTNDWQRKYNFSLSSCHRVENLYAELLATSTVKRCL
jgi:hypothetical protein